MKTRLSYANVMSTIAVVIAMGTGSAYAVTQLPLHSVGRGQLVNGSVTGKKVKDGSLKAKDFKAGQLPSGPKGEKGDKGEKGTKGDPGAPAGAYLGAVSNVTILATPANTCTKGTLTEPGVKPGDTVLVVPDYNGTFPIQISVTPGISPSNGTVVAQFCNESAANFGGLANQTVAFWRIVGPTP